MGPYLGAGTLTIWIPDQYGFQMVDLCLVVKWSSIQLVVWKSDWKKPVLEWSAVAWLYHSNTGHHFCPVFRWIQYSYCYCIKKTLSLFVCRFTVCTYSFWRIFCLSSLFYLSHTRCYSPSFHRNTSPKWLTPSFSKLHAWRHPGRVKKPCML